MFTPAMTASSVSPPALSISIARAQARAPLPLAITMFLGPGCAPAGAAEDKAAALNIQSLLVMCRSPYGNCGNLDCKSQMQDAPAVFTKFLQPGYDFGGAAP